MKIIFSHLAGSMITITITFDSPVFAHVEYGSTWKGRQHCRLSICIELVELTNSEMAAARVSDDKIQITILILRRGALSMFGLVGLVL